MTEQEIIMTKQKTSNVGLLACTLQAPEQAKRRGEIQALIDGAGKMEKRHDGVSLRFQNTTENAHALLEFIRFEQQCCAELTYELCTAPPHTELTLRLRAPEALAVSLQSFYLHSEPEAPRQANARTGNKSSRNFDRLRRVFALSTPFGAVLCAVICLGVPTVSGALGIVGLGCLRDDRILMPFELLCCTAFLWSFERDRRVHGNWYVLLFAVAAAGFFLGSMFLSGVGSQVALLSGCAILIAATGWNRRLLKNCCREKTMD